MCSKSYKIYAHLGSGSKKWKLLAQILQKSWYINPTRYTNQQVANILHQVSTALTLKKRNMFEVRAYENAATAIEENSNYRS